MLSVGGVLNVYGDLDDADGRPAHVAATAGRAGGHHRALVGSGHPASSRAGLPGLEVLVLRHPVTAEHLRALPATVRTVYVHQPAELTAEPWPFEIRRITFPASVIPAGW